MVTRDLPRFYPVISVTVFHISVQTLLFSGIRRLCVSSKRSKLDRPIPLKGISFAKDVNQGVFYLGSPVRRVHPFDGFIEKTHLSSSLRNKFIWYVSFASSINLTCFYLVFIETFSYTFHKRGLIFRILNWT